MRASGDRRRRAGRASRATAMPQVARRASRAGTAPAPGRPAALGAAREEQHRAGSASAIALIAGRFLLPDLQPLGARPKQQTDKELDAGCHAGAITPPPVECGGCRRRPAPAGWVSLASGPRRRPTRGTSGSGRGRARQARCSPARATRRRSTRRTSQEAAAARPARSTLLGVQLSQSLLVPR